ncbi:hypothetical protein DESC_610303 [Desulfosarcina cetonica]|nr:hypothetical protein DESC_610303 [Desulfosarcina cetonica]
MPISPQPNLCAVEGIVEVGPTGSEKAEFLGQGLQFGNHGGAVFERIHFNALDSQVGDLPDVLVTKLLFPGVRKDWDATNPDDRFYGLTCVEKVGCRSFGPPV